MASRIRDVWASNLEAEMHNIRELIDRYPYVALDTEFPGVVARPIGSFKAPADYHYQTMRCNVDLLKIIQLGIALSAEDGSLPGEDASSSIGPNLSTNGIGIGGDGSVPGPSHGQGGTDAPSGAAVDGITSNSIVAWQFNFRFDAADDMYNPEALELLHKAGLDLARHAAEGIRPADFAELLITSGLVLNDDVYWISFHSAYDFGYLLRALTAQSLPQAESDFFSLLTTWFPSLYDIKCLLRPARLRIAGGLAAVADELGVRPHPAATAYAAAISSSSRVNPSARQAGADALLATGAFHALRIRAFGGLSAHPPTDYNGRLYGLGVSAAGGASDADTDDNSNNNNGNVSGVGAALNAVMGMGGVSATTAAAAAAAAAAGVRAAVGMGLTPAERSRSPAMGQAGGAQGTTPQLSGSAAVGVGGSGAGGGGGGAMGLGGGGMGLGAPTPGPGGVGVGVGIGAGAYHGHAPGGMGGPSPYGSMGNVGVNGAAYHLRQINVGGDR